MPGRPRSVNPFRVLLIHRNFRRFWTGQSISLIGTWMQAVAQGWLALELTNDAFMVGLVAAAGSLPVLLFSLPAGVLADRTDKLRLITTAQSLMLVVATLLWWFVWSENVTIAWLVVFAFASGSFQAVDIPARQALMVELVGRNDLIDAIALNSTGFNLARIIGPSLAAVIIAQLGLAWCFGLNALSFVAVLAGLTRIRRPPPRVLPRLSPWDGVVQGLRFVSSTPEVAVLMRQTAMFSIFGVPFLSLMPVFARDVLGLGASGYGLLLTFVGVGAVTGALSLAALGHRIGRGRLLLLSAHAFAVALIALAGARSVMVAVAILFMVGLTMILNNAITNGLLQTIAPDEFRGRVMSVYSLVFVGLSPVGALVGGAVARGAGISIAIAGSATILLAYSAYTFTRYPVVRRL